MSKLLFVSLLFSWIPFQVENYNLRKDTKVSDDDNDDDYGDDDNKNDFEDDDDNHDIHDDDVNAILVMIMLIMMMAMM